MTNIKKSWYEINKDMVVKTTRESVRGVIANFWAPKLILGKASISFLSRFLLGQFEKEEERKVMIVVDSNLEKYANRVEKSLARRGFQCKIWNGVQPEVPLDVVNSALDVFNQFSPKILVAIGGGSAIDTAKLIFLKYEKPDFDFYGNMPFNSIGLRKKIKYFIAIPTTSGTGSEASFGSMLLDTSQTPPKKVHVTFLELLPDLAVLSNEFVKDMPSWLTAGTGIDALVHAMSSYVSSCHNSLGDNASLGAIKLIVEYLPRAFKRGYDLEAREKMQYAAFLAGLSVTNIGISLDHSLGHALGDIYHVHHGISVGIFFPYVIQFLAKVTDRFIDFAEFFNISIDSRPNEDILDDFIKDYKAFLKSLDLPTSVKDLKTPIINKEDYLKNLDQLVEFALDDVCTYDNLRIPTRENLENLFIYAYDGKNVDF